MIPESRIGKVDLLNSDLQTVATEDRITYSVGEVAALLGVSERFVAELVKTGQLRSSKIGKRRLIRRESIIEMLDAEDES